MRFLLAALLLLTLNVEAQTMPTAQLTHSIRTPEGTFANPSGSPQANATWWDFQKFFWSRIVFGGTPQVPPGHVIPAAQAQSQWQATAGDKLQWLGHSAFRMQVGGLTILTDPLLTSRASPFQWAGPKRFVPSPLKPEDARADLILLSHNHYDHLDLETLKALPNKDTVQVIVPLGVAPLVKSAGIAHVTELDWHQSITISNTTVTLLPAVHFSARWTNDRNATLWGGYLIKSGNLAIYQTGDTTYHPTLFKQIGQAYGPIDYALVPIGAYEPRKIMVGSHTTPEEAVHIGQDVSATTLIGHHWGALVLTTEDPFEPPVRFRAAASAAGVPEPRTWLLKVGETRPLIK
jgi:L-ascorbate metabolism protein UlaG (beta-lactamase superfamily)